MGVTIMDPLPRIDALESQVRDLLAVVTAKDAALVTKDATIADLTARLQAMEVRLSAMQRRIFGRSSEQLHDPGQLVWCGAVPQPHDHYSLRERHEGARRVARRARCRWVELGDFSAVADGALTRELTPRAGVIAYDTIHAQWLAHATARLGIALGQTAALACADTTHDIGLTWPRLSRVHVDRFSLGTMAADMLLKLLGGAKVQVASVRAEVRWITGSTAVPADHVRTYTNQQA